MLYTTVLQWVKTCMNSSEQAEITSYRQDNLGVAFLLNGFHKKKQYSDLNFHTVTCKRPAPNVQVFCICMALNEQSFTPLIDIHLQTYYPSSTLVPFYIPLNVYTQAILAFTRFIPFHTSHLMLTFISSCLIVVKHPWRMYFLVIKHMYLHSNSLYQIQALWLTSCVILRKLFNLSETVFRCLKIEISIVPNSQDYKLSRKNEIVSDTLKCFYSHYYGYYQEIHYKNQHTCFHF